MSELRVHLLPHNVSPEALAGSTVVVIDVLRATTTMVYALAAGARAIMPCLEVEAARAAARRLGNVAVLAGERGGLPLPGFELGNSPAEFTPEAVGGKIVVLTTTNGTRALAHSRHAAEILIGAFVNLTAVAAALVRRPQVDLLCAGTDGRRSGDDTLLAGAMAWQLAEHGPWNLDAKAIAARKLWQETMGTSRETRARLAAALRVSPGGQNLVRVGLESDIETAAQIDRFSLLPRYDPAAGEVAVR